MTDYRSNRDEIVELAQLEVLGALESADCARLERLFRDATPSVQSEVIEVQAAMAFQSALLPVIEPERSLRLRVLAKVAQAVEESDAELAPIALIGRPSSATSGGVSLAGGVSLTSASSLSDRSTPMRVMEDAHWRRSALVWRAACIAVIGGLVAALAFDVSTSRQATRISELALQNASSAELSALIGPGLPEFLDQRCVVKGLVGATVRDNGSATVMLAPTLDSAYVVWFDLSVGQKLTLQSFDRQSGIAHDAGSFSIVNPVGGTRFPLQSGVANANSDWRIVDMRGAVVFTTRPE